MLLHHKTGAATYEDLRPIDGDECSTFQAACLQMGLLDHDSERNWVMEKASSIRFGPPLGEVFYSVIPFAHCSHAIKVINPFVPTTFTTVDLWKNCWFAHFQLIADAILPSMAIVTSHSKVYSVATSYIRKTN